MGAGGRHRADRGRLRIAVWAMGSVLLGIGTAMVYPTLLAAIGDVAPPRVAGLGLGRVSAMARRRVRRRRDPGGCARRRVRRHDRRLGDRRADSSVRPVRGAPPAVAQCDDQAIAKREHGIGGSSPSWPQCDPIPRRADGYHHPVVAPGNLLSSATNPCSTQWLSAASPVRRDRDRPVVPARRVRGPHRSTRILVDEAQHRRKVAAAYASNAPLGRSPRSRFPSLLLPWLAEQSADGGRSPRSTTRRSRCRGAPVGAETTTKIAPAVDAGPAHPSRGVMEGSDSAERSHACSEYHATPRGTQPTSSLPQHVATRCPAHVRSSLTAVSQAAWRVPGASRSLLPFMGFRSRFDTSAGASSSWHSRTDCDKEAGIDRDQRGDARDQLSHQTRADGGAYCA